MHRKSLASGITILFLLTIISSLTMGIPLDADISEQSKVSDAVFARTPYRYIGDNQSMTIYGDPRYQYDLSPFLSPVSRSDHGLMDSPWPMKAHDLHHTSRSPYTSNDGGGLEKWRFWTDFYVESPAVIDDQGMIYFGVWNDYLRALYPNGTEKWAYKTNGFIWNSPALAEDGTIYVPNWGDDKLYAIYSGNGTLKWKVNLGGSVFSSPAIAPDGTIYASTQGEHPNGHSIVAVHPNGTIYWKYLTGADVVSEPAVGDDGTVYCGSWDTHLYAINPNGTLKWRFKTGGAVVASPAIADDGTVYISSYDSWLYALHPDTGSLIWKYTDGGDEGGPAIGPDGIIYLGNSKLRAIYPNGTAKYVVDIGPNIDYGTPALSLDGILYLSAGSSIYAVDSEDGSVLWQKRIVNEWHPSSPILGPDGTVYIGSAWTKLHRTGEGLDSNGYLHAFGPVVSNSPPDTPLISSDSIAEKGENHVFRFICTDSDNNPIQFYIDWGDGEITNWTDEAASGEYVYVNHDYRRVGTYTIRGKARDSSGAESDWGTHTIPVYNYGIKLQSRGLFISLIIRNKGMNSLKNVSWKITLHTDHTKGLVFWPEEEELSGTIDTILPFQARRIRIPIVGVGVVGVHLEVYETSNWEKYFMVGPLGVFLPWIFFP